MNWRSKRVIGDKVKFANENKMYENIEFKQAEYHNTRRFNTKKHEVRLNEGWVEYCKLE